MTLAIRVALLMEKVFILAAIIYVVNAVLSFAKPVEIHAPLTTYPHSEISSIEQTKELTPQPVRDFEDVVPSRDLFNAAMPGKELNNNAPIVNTLPGNFKVVGVIIAKPPELAIEDINTHQTFFIAQGGRAQDIEVVEVLPHQAVLKYQGQDIVLPIEKK